MFVNSSFDKGLSVLGFFKEGSISAHLDDIVDALGMSKATAYRYVGSLCDAGLLAPTAGGVYVLGPRIIELDRLIRISDPLLIAGSKVMHEVSERRRMNMMLASYYRDSIMCVDIAWPDPSIPANFERGKPMSLFRGAMAKIILANLSPYQLRNVALNRPDEIREAGLGGNWAEFRAHMSKLMRDGYAITRAEMMPGGGGISAPIFDPDKKVLGSITFVVAESKFAETDFERLRRWIVDAAEQITVAIAQETDSASITPPLTEGRAVRRSASRGRVPPRQELQETSKPVSRTRRKQV
jgi:DNA-binding IclR family transcriptional regulator